MDNRNELIEFLKQEFKITKNQLGLHSVDIVPSNYPEEDVYKHVKLELNDFTLADWQFKKIFEACNKFNYSFHMIPRGERDSNARHCIIFHK